MKRWILILVIGAVIFSLGLSTPWIMEELVYDTPSDVNSLPYGAYVSIVGSITNKGYEQHQGFGGIGNYIEINGFKGRVVCKENDFQIGEKVIVTGYLLDGLIQGYDPYGTIKVFDGNFPAEVSRAWWPSISFILLLPGIVIIITGVADFAYSHRKRMTTSG